MPRLSEALQGLAPALWVALMTAAVGLFGDLSSGAPGYEDGWLLLTPVAPTVAYLTGAGGFFLFIGWALGRLAPSLPSLGFGLTLGLGVYTAAAPYFGAYPAPLPGRQSAHTVPTLVVAGLIGLLGAALWAQQSAAGRRRALISGAAMAIGALLGDFALWATLFPLGLDLSPAAVWLGIAFAAGFAVRTVLGRRTPVAAALTLLGAATLSLVGFAPALDVPSGRSPAISGAAGRNLDHVFLITIDTLRADAVFSTPTLTPNIDALAVDSIVFEHAISGGPWTPPGLTSILTGLSPSVHRRVRFNSPPLPSAVPTLASFFDAQGWRTSAVARNMFVTLLGLDAQFQWRHTHAPPSLGRSFGERALEQISPRFLNDPTTTQLVDWALDRLEAVPAGPHFFWLHLLDPHGPYQPPARFLDAEAQPDPRIGRRYDPANPPLHAHDEDPAMRAWVRQLYHAEVRYTDAEVGRFLDDLRERGLYEDALIVLVSDHGEEFWERGMQDHGKSLHNELLHVPLMIKLPGASVQKRITQYASTVAVAPTILDMAGIEYDSSRFSESSLRPYWQGGPEAPRPAFSSGVYRFADRTSVVLDGKKYIAWSYSGVEETFDLVANPLEREQAFDEAFAETARTLVERRRAVSKKLREGYGLSEPREAQRDPGTLDALRGLGYVQ